MVDWLMVPKMKQIQKGRKNNKLRLLFGNIKVFSSEGEREIEETDSKNEKERSRNLFLERTKENKVIEK